ncbi:hypothetical protein [Rufibacter psychrotolerans]|uniref:hypothetical protein n=1 Tax=Rufibacter psychrotolerans TaxID=2812556 RepID=UPI001966D08A|nr:hypothetical protein [Rufibacter sp. SYSU D00308]
MKRKVLFQLFALGLLWQVTACQVTENQLGEGDGPPATSQWLVYHETQCADPWGYCNKNPDTRVCVREYVENQGYTVADISVTPAPPDFAACEACQCPSGRVFKVRVTEPDVAKLLAVGFKKL